MDINARIAARVAHLRRERNLSLDALAELSGVSRSMISLVERGQSNATATVLEKLAAGLGVPLAGLFEDPAPAASPLVRRADQPEWRDPQSGYLRRNLSPPPSLTPIRMVEVEFPAGAQVSYDSVERDVRVHQQVWVLEGRIEITVGDTVHALAAGDCLAFDLERPNGFRNPGRSAARYVVVVVTERTP